MAPVLVNSQTVDKIFTVFTLKESAHALSGQRDGLSHIDVTNMATSYGSTCGKKISKHIILYTLDIGKT